MHRGILGCRRWADGIYTCSAVSSLLFKIMINVVCVSVFGVGSVTWIGFSPQHCRKTHKCEGGSERDSGIHMTRESYINRTIMCLSPSYFLKSEN